ncbi:LysM peptidoglycan-binding domain-containing protein [Paenibacillus sp. NFR01]|uniref:LysM peptidoglycan-binding domain-containing protein n=1 Tax=Paenibacillus sp. NFR01 TaxID=1566279 RepID=UPI0008C7980A|nr:LysM peptidoglycan-binding domain-containing protein [Paenibacillus sp. NFR01]SEU26614.1 LysM domain-containing protein [Paenibacillus sp. NFR01]
MEEYGFFLGFNNFAEVIRLPVNPETLEIKEAGDSKSYTIVDRGEINAIMYPKLAEISLEGIFPAQYYPFVVYPEQEADRLLRPYEYVTLIKKWMASRKPIRFVFSGLQSLKGSSGSTKVDAEAASDQADKGDLGVNMPMSIESFSWKLSAGSSGDIEYQLALKKYEFYQSLAVKTVDKEVKVQTKRPNDKSVPKTYTIKAGDTLSGIAQKMLGDSGKWKQLQKLNGISDSETKKLKIGRVIKLS